MNVSLKPLSFALLFICSLLFVSSDLTAQSTTVSLTADRDNSMYEESPTFSNGSGIFLFAGATRQTGASPRRALVHFDLSSIPSSATVQSATLQLTMNKTPTGSASVQTIHALTQDWGESTSDANGREGQGISAAAGDATWSANFFGTSSWTSPGGDFVATASASSTVSTLGAYTWGSTPQMVADVQSWLTTPANNFGWLLRGDESQQLTARRYCSRENAEASCRPTLTIAFTSLPVELSNFDITTQGHSVALNWTTLSEDNNAGFQVEMAHLVDSQALSPQLNWTQLGFVEGNGSTTERHDYRFNHELSEPGSYRFRLKQVDFDGSFDYSTVLETYIDFAESHILSSAYPNPFTERAHINLILSSDDEVSVSLFDSMGRSVQEVFSGSLVAGTRYQFEVEAGDLPEGVYFYQVQGSNFSDSDRIVLIR